MERNRSEILRQLICYAFDERADDCDVTLSECLREYKRAVLEERERIAAPSSGMGRYDRKGGVTAGQGGCAEERAAEGVGPYGELGSGGRQSSVPTGEAENGLSRTPAPTGKTGDVGALPGASPRPTGCEGGGACDAGDRNADGSGGRSTPHQSASLTASPQGEASGDGARDVEDAVPYDAEDVETEGRATGGVGPYGEPGSGGRQSAVPTGEKTSGTNANRLATQMKKQTHARLLAFRQEYGLGCFGKLAALIGHGIDDITLSRMASGEKFGIEDWRLVAAGLDRAEELEKEEGTT
jgi:hypothetical protein